MFVAKSWPWISEEALNLGVWTLFGLWRLRWISVCFGWKIKGPSHYGVEGDPTVDYFGWRLNAKLTSSGLWWLIVVVKLTKKEMTSKAWKLVKKAPEYFQVGLRGKCVLWMGQRHPIDWRPRWNKRGKHASIRQSLWTPQWMNWGCWSSWNAGKDSRI